jgi:hypothetical protein
VYQYTDASGRSVQAVCRTGSDDLRRLRTGRSVGLRVAKDDPHAVREANDFVLEFLGAALLAGAIWQLGLAHGPVLLRSLPVVAGVGLVYAAVSRFLGTRRPSAAPPAGYYAPSSAQPAMAPVATAEQVAAAHRLQGEMARRRVLAPFLIVFGLLFVVGGGFSGRSALGLKRHGASAPGTVVELVAGPVAKGGSTERALVRFAASTGEAVWFEDTVASSPPPYRVGEAVRVVYLANSPAASAVIDRGIWNLLGPLIGAGIGLLGLTMGVSIWMHRLPVDPAPASGSAPLWQSAITGEPAAAVPGAAIGASHARRWCLVLFLLAVALCLAPPFHKTGDAALAVFLCFLVVALAALGAIIDFAAQILLAGLKTTVAVRSGAARGLDAGDSGAAWAAAADDSPRLQSVLLHYAHLRRAFWVTQSIILVFSIWLSASEPLRRFITGGP